MKLTRNVLFALLLLGCAAGAASAATSFSAGVHVGPSGRAAVDLGFFYDNLAPYGHWIQRPHYGWVWTPRSVAAGWRPYSYGHWINSDLGWTWMSDEPFGWATYHYGRWYQDPEIGWAWVPGTQWGPAWVSWQEGSDYVGWAALPPGANIGVGDSYGYDNGYGYDDGYGYDNSYDNGYGYDDSYGYGGGYGYGGYGYGGYGSGVSVSFSFGISPAAYLFVPVRYFLAPSLFSYYAPYDRIYPIFRTTRNCTSYRYYGGHYYNTGLPYDHIRRAVGRVPRYQLSELGSFRDGRYGARIDGNRVAFFQPRVDRNGRVSPLSRPEARRSVISAQQFRNTYRDRVTRDRQLYQGGRQAQGYRNDGVRGTQRQQDQRWQQQGQYRNDRQRGYDAQRQQQPYQGGRQARPYDNNQRGQGQVERQRAWENQQRQQQQYQQQYRNDRQRSYDNQRGQAERQRAWENQQRQQQYQQQYRNDRQRSYDNQRGQAERQRAWENQRQQQRYERPQPRNDRQDRQQYRGEGRRGGEDNNSRQHGRGHGRGQAQ